jgi:hypothetical protein
MSQLALDEASRTVARPLQGYGNFLVQVCSYCDEQIELSEGDTILGNEWYHRRCWEEGSLGGSKGRLQGQD